MDSKYQDLCKRVREMESCVIAFSGGVDSTLLAKVAAEVLNPEKVILVTASSETFTEEELRRAGELAAEIGLKHKVVRTPELQNPEFNCNPPDKCYHCKKIRYGGLDDMRKELGFNFIADGTNADDAGDFRPGERAAKEIGVRHPLKEAGFTKAEVREMSRQKGLSNWNLSSQACLASRIPYGTPLTADLLKKVGEAEKLVREMWGIDNVRVRHFGDTAKIEISPERMRIVTDDNLRTGVVEALKKLGYKYVTMDLQGYRSGSMNESLSEREAAKARGEN